jgi:hypothetical protein
MKDVCALKSATSSDPIQPAFRLSADYRYLRDFLLPALYAHAEAEEADETDA